ncbi:MAG: TIGR02281 family clan AA aspartic protease [Sphingomonadales bacterium]|nr:TIGR02281 family clan AA aspartic protease [Sphingomonadales bacterium]
MSDKTPELIWYIGALVLVGSALLARPLKFGQFVRYSLAWIAIFMAAYGVFLFRDDLSGAWNRARADLGGAPEAGVDGKTILVRRDADGHFWVNAGVNGIATRFLIDSGASTTSIPRALAQRSGVTDRESGFPVLIETANGTTTMKRATIDRLTVGGLSVANHPVMIGDALGETGVLGMNFLSALRSWKVEGATLVLEP